MKVVKIDHARHDYDGVIPELNWKKYDEEHYDIFVFKEDLNENAFLTIEVHDEEEMGEQIVYHFKRDGKGYIFGEPLDRLSKIIEKRLKSYSGVSQRLVESDC